MSSEEIADWFFEELVPLAYSTKEEAKKSFYAWVGDLPKGYSFKVVDEGEEYLVFEIICPHGESVVSVEIAEAVDIEEQEEKEWIWNDPEQFICPECEEEAINHLDNLEGIASLGRNDTPSVCPIHKTPLIRKGRGIVNIAEHCSPGDIISTPGYGYQVLTKEDLEEMRKQNLRVNKMIGDSLLVRFAGCRLEVGELYRKHTGGYHSSAYKSTFKDVLRRLEAEGKIVTEPPANKRRKRWGKVTFADTVEVMFPPRS